MSLAKILLKLKSIKEFNNMLEVLLTPKERLEIDQRIEIIKRLEKGHSQHKIASELGVGIATVTRGSKVVRNDSYQHVKNILCE